MPNALGELAIEKEINAKDAKDAKKSKRLLRLLRALFAFEARNTASTQNSNLTLGFKSQNRLEMGHDTDHISSDLNINDGLNRFIGRRGFLNSTFRSQRDTINSG